MWLIKCICIHINIYSNLLNRRPILKWRLHKFASLLANNNEGEDLSTGLYFFGVTCIYSEMANGNGKNGISIHLCSISFNVVLLFSSEKATPHMGDKYTRGCMYRAAEYTQ